MIKDKYFKNWAVEDTPIEWQKRGRRSLNLIIDRVNDWTLNGCLIGPTKSAHLLRFIDQGLQTFADSDGGSGWADVLREMKEYIEEKVKDSDV